MSRWGTPGQYNRPPHDQSGSGYQFSVAMKLAEMAAEVRGLRQDMHHHLMGLPERMARQMVLHINQSTLCKAKSSKTGQLLQLTQLLKSGLPYVVFAWRTLLLLALWSLIGTGAYTSDDVGRFLAGMLRGFWSG